MGQLRNEECSFMRLSGVQWKVLKHPWVVDNSWYSCTINLTSGCYIFVYNTKLYDVK